MPGFASLAWSSEKGGVSSFRPSPSISLALSLSLQRGWWPILIPVPCKSSVSFLWGSCLLYSSRDEWGCRFFRIGASLGGVGGSNSGGLS